jgi:glycosyltransferase involved in cell wall biosynthesis
MIHLVTLTHNDQDSLPPFLAAVQVASRDWNQPFRALVVDDGSTDETAEIVSDFSQYGDFELLRHAERMGEGAALRTGLNSALEAAVSTDLIVTLDPRHIHSPALVKAMLPLLRDVHDVVIASRYASGSHEVGLSPLHRVVLRGSAWLMGRLYSIAEIDDYTGRCRGHRAEILQQLASRYHGRLIEEEQGSACWVEVLLKLAHLGHTRFAQIPQTVRHDLQPSPNRGNLWYLVRQQARIISRGRRYC